MAIDLRRSRVREVRLTWNANLAYAVGLVATDGCLLGTGRHVAFVSKDLDQIHTFLRCIDRLGATIRHDGTAFRVYFGDVELYDWLKAIGLTPRKSLTLGGLAVPDEFSWMRFAACSTETVQSPTMCMSQIARIIPTTDTDDCVSASTQRVATTSTGSVRGCA